MNLLNKIGGPIVRLMLRSPLHSLISKNVMLLTVTGRKSGKRYVIPVGYVREGDRVTTSTLRGNRWWKNLHGGAPVSLRIEGQEFRGTAEIVVDDQAAIAAILREHYKLASLHALSDEEAAERAADRVIIQIQLDQRG